MKDADQIILEGLTQTILEKTLPSELYHYSSLRSVGKMIKSDTIMLSFANLGGSDNEINHGKYFFLSLSYDKWGRYAGGSGDARYRNQLYNTQVSLVFDTRALQADGKMVDVDYWKSDKYSDDEKEVRFLSDTQKLYDVSKYVSEIHVYIEQPRVEKGMFGRDGETIKPSVHEHDIRYYNRLADSDVPTYFYNNASAFKQMLKRAGSEDYTKMMPNEISDFGRSSKSRNYDGNISKDISNLAHFIVLGEIPENDRFNSIKRIKDGLKNDWNTREVKITISNELHNAKSSHPEAYQSIVNFLKQNKLKGIDDLVEFLKNRERGVN